MPLFDKAKNALLAGSDAQGKFIGQTAGEVDGFPLSIYEMIDESIRALDKSEGQLLLQRMLHGPQREWEETVARISALEGLRGDRIRFYDIDQILSSTEFETYRNAVRQNETSIRALRAELSKWPVVMQAMARRQPPLALGNIFTADVIGSGDVLVLYFRARNSSN